MLYSYLLSVSREGKSMQAESRQGCQRLGKQSLPANRYEFLELTLGMKTQLYCLHRKPWDHTLQEAGLDGV